MPKIIWTCSTFVIFDIQLCELQCREQGQESHYIQHSNNSSTLTSKGLLKVKIATVSFNAIKYCNWKWKKEKYQFFHCMDRICLFLITWTEYVLYCMWNCGHLTYFCYVFTMGVMVRKVIFSHQNFHNPYEMLSLVLFPKGQLISKCLLVSPILPKKELETQIFALHCWYLWYENLESLGKCFVSFFHTHLPSTFKGNTLKCAR